jgi:hypothetical protein
MSEYENVFKLKEIHDIYAAGEVKPLDDLYLVEDIALTIGDMNKKISFYKDYKKKRKQDIDDEIKVLENKIDFFKAVIVSTLKKSKEKSIKFPGSCAVSARNQKEKWTVTDENEFVTMLLEAKKSGEDVSDALEEVMQYNIRKREANKLLNIWEQSGKLDGFFEKAKKSVNDVIKKEPQKTTVSIKYEEDTENEVEDSVNDVVVPKKIDSSALEEFDSLQ